MSSDRELLNRLFLEFDRLNSADTRMTDTLEGPVPFQVFHSREVHANILKLTSLPSTALQIAARSQHLLRFTKPRNTYPEGKAGYHKWKNDLKQFHADKTSEVLREHGCDETLINRVSELNRKIGLKTDQECQFLEDALCLFFLQHQFEEFTQLHTKEKLIPIIQKSWAKMGSRGRELALGLPYSEKAQDVLKAALSNQD